jgi:hypothetical protein
VEDAMFQFPKHYLTQIPIFSTTFSLPPSKDGIEGLTEENPFVLEQISKLDFKAFLKVLIPLYVNSSLNICQLEELTAPRMYIIIKTPFRQVPSNYSNISVEVWKSTLKLSTMWEVTALRDLAIRNLNQLDMVDMILLGSKYRVSQWFITGCTKLIMRNHGPTEEEGILLGIGFVVQIYGLRERMLLLRITKGSGACLDCQRIVRETFPDKIFD